MNGVVYVAEGLNVYAINGGNGSLVWNTQITEVNFAGFSSPVISEGLIFAGNYAGYLFAFDLATGVEKWRYYDSNAPSISWPQGPVGAHGMVVTDRGDNVLKAFFASTGKLIWTFTADGQLTYPCILDVEGNAFYAAASGNIN
jgi:outer membrane protein assembly factor BamB